MKSLHEDDRTSVAEKSEILQDPTDAVSRIEKLDWQQITKELNEQGNAMLMGVLTPEECGALAGLYQDESGFRSRVVMARHGFGRGEYKYFNYPLPGIVQVCAACFIANWLPLPLNGTRQWESKSGILGTTSTSFSAATMPDSHARLHSFFGSVLVTTTACIRIFTGSTSSRFRLRFCSPSRDWISPGESLC
jgi:hypothetical protein